MNLNINPQNASDWGSFVSGLVAVLAAIWAIFSWPFKWVDRIYVRKVEKDGTRNYVHPTELVTVNNKLDKIIEHLNIQ